MKKLLLIIGLTLAGYSISYGQDNIQEAYFHDLYGMEDNYGNIHLFYRVYVKHLFPCTYEDYKGDAIETNITLRKNNVHQFDPVTNSDSIRFNDNDTVLPECVVRRSPVQYFTFLNNDPGKAFIVKTDYLGDLPPYLRDWRGNFLGYDYTSPLNVEIDSVKNKVFVPTPLEHVVVKSQAGMPPLRSTIAANIDGSDWESLNLYDEIPDSLLFDFSILAVNPYKNNEYLVVREDSLFRSLDHGDSLSFMVQDSRFENVSADVFFEPELDHYFISFGSWSPDPALSKDFWKLYSSNEEWQFEQIKPDAKINAISTDPSSSGKLFLGSETELFISTDYGDSHSSFMSFDDMITGLYKKPDSDILYVLTKEELLEVNTETGESSSLRKLPVSNEPEPPHTYLPRSVELHQNYPNPFNPATVIGYRLPETRNVTLEVFDITGRRVATLVDGLQQAGQHETTFDASNLASGVYFYRLEAGDFVQARQMVLVK